MEFRDVNALKINATTIIVVVKDRTTNVHLNVDVQGA